MNVLIVVGLVWLIVAGRAVIKVRNEERVASVEGFQRQLRSFGGELPPLEDSPAFGSASDNPSIGRAPAISALRGRLGPHRAQRLRRALAALLIAALLTLVAAIVLSSRLALGLHLLVDNVLLAYVALLVRRRDAGPPKPGRQKRHENQEHHEDHEDHEERRARAAAVNEDDEYAEYADFRVLSPRAGDLHSDSKPAMAGAR